MAENLLAACAAGIAATLIVTPFDVLKTRLQVASPTHPRPPILGLHARTHGGQAYRCLLAMDGVQHSCLVHSPWQQLSSLDALHPVRVAPKVSYSALPHPATLNSILRQILREEGVRGFWKGLDTAMLLNIPLVSIYMSLYDALYSRMSKDMGMYAPAVAGAVARTVTVLSVAPLELVRTRQQASVASSHLMSSFAAAWKGSSGGGPAAERGALTAALARAQGLWTGVGATLARDLPFTCLYWCVVEPLRSHLLSEQLARVPVWQPATSSSGSGSCTASSSTGAHLVTVDANAHSAPSSCSEQDAARAATSLSSGATSTAGSADALLPTPAPTMFSPSGAAAATTRQVLWANLLAGSTAGALAAAVTTPMDVLKTRLQTLEGQPVHSCCTAGKPAGPPPRGLELLRDIYRAEGLRGLFAGIVPRVARAAPACAVVLSTYELLKSWGGQSSERV